MFIFDINIHSMIKKYFQNIRMIEATSPNKSNSKSIAINTFCNHITAIIVLENF